MGKCINLTGQKFGRLTVIQRAETTKHGAVKWLCECECGNVVIVIGDELRKGNTSSCGCYAKEVAKKTALKHIAGHNKTHGKTKTPIYKEWAQMKRRCYNPKSADYNRYGGRGITMCDRWRNSFEAFYEDVSKLPNYGKKGYSINRINNDGNYEPNNVEWADDITQANNRRSNHYVLYNGERFTIAELAKSYNVPYKKLYKRIAILQWDIEKALNTP